MNPYAIDGPAVISFSGGRSSGFMLRNIIDAHGGTLPDDIKVIFANTGLEHHETYEFIHRIEENWCDVTWLEYTRKDKNWIAQGEPTKNAYFKIVNFETSSKKGEPFKELILGNKMSNGKYFMPNPRMRVCTHYLKVLTKHHYLINHLNWSEWFNCVGLRNDEQRRVNKIKGHGKQEELLLPMNEAGHGKHDVYSFWKNHKLDLKLESKRSVYGNCVGCFLKGYKQLEIVGREQPNHLDWWINMERKTNDRFAKMQIPEYATIKRDAHLQQAFDFGDSVSCFCTD